MQPVGNEGMPVKKNLLEKHRLEAGYEKQKDFFLTGITPFPAGCISPSHSVSFYIIPLLRLTLCLNPLKLVHNILPGRSSRQTDYHIYRNRHNKRRKQFINPPDSSYGLY